MELVEKGGWGARFWEWISKRGDQADRPVPVGRWDAQLEQMSREDLLDARQKLTRQVEILAAGPVRQQDATPMSAVLINDLQQAIDAVDAELAKLDAADASGDRDGQADSSTADDVVEFEGADELGDPSILSHFTATMLNAVQSPGGVVWTNSLLTCPDCIGGDMFSIVFHPKVAPDPSPYDGVAPGDTVRSAPYSARCIECGVEKTLYDPDAAGFSAILKGAVEDDTDERGPTDETGAVTLYVALGYRRPIDELKSLAAKSNVVAADLFESIVIRGEAPNGDRTFDQSIDCSPPPA